MEDVRALEWDDEIEVDGNEFVVLEAGDYDFEVVSFERGRFNGSEKTPPCNMAIVTFKITSNQGDAFVKNNFYLASNSEWKISEFYRSIGLKKHGEKLRMRWGEITGCKGRCKVTKDAGTKNKDTFFNNIAKFYDPDSASAAAPAKKPSGTEW